jgi:hypothetical protein
MTHGMLEVLVQVARSGRVYHEDGPTGLQCPVDVLQNLRRVSQVVDHVERRDELVAIPLFKPRRILDLEANVIESLQLRILPGSGDARFGEIVAHETAVREGPGHEVERDPLPAPDVHASDPTLQAFDQPGNEGKGAADEGRAVDLYAILRH